jgi:hypothetical protein
MVVSAARPPGHGRTISNVPTQIPTVVETDTTDITSERLRRMSRSPMKTPDGLRERHQWFQIPLTGNSKRRTLFKRNFITSAQNRANVFQGSLPHAVLRGNSLTGAF